MDLPALRASPCWHMNGLVCTDSVLAYGHRDWPGLRRAARTGRRRDGQGENIMPPIQGIVNVFSPLYTECQYQCQLERHSVERIYIRQRSPDGSVNKTILKSRLALAARHKAAKFRSLYDIGESNSVPASGL